MSDKPTTAEIERALRASLEAALPSIIAHTVRLLHAPVPPVAVAAAHDALPALLSAGRHGGDNAVLAILPEDHASLLAISKALDRVLAQRHRKLKNLDRMRSEIAAEVVRRATRNDVFLTHE